ncbi:hypothetical protein DMB92_03900 [Campylobacter sp. MIT 99-7217]|uniref:hypothetical protein n=1 Tax=Campylobacter sp. MIT 99-7217 TaxID=535091 RepID=UPI00115BD811|nr:hypothetical protein [Campylobacter sp. MIT 99-7217]TQR33110.1 hypothetical protein DMB92_03900 [Campylobacter sp. MIT 99-7217]
MKKNVFILSFLCIFAYADKCKSAEMQEALMQIKSIFNLPQKIDKITILKDIVCENDTLGYIYDIEFNDFDQKLSQNNNMQELMKKSILAQNKSYYCDSDLSAYYRDEDMAMSWTYYKNGEIFIHNKISNKDCLK